MSDILQPAFCQTPCYKQPFRVLNLYACLGGNRLLWEDCDVTAVELDTELARLYQERFPKDKVIVADAHQYLLDHYKEFDFIWSSPPCPTHSRMRLTNTGEGERKSKATFPDMKLYEEVIFLDNFFDGKYVVENVIPYYEPLITAKKRGRHLYWCNFKLPNDLGDRKADNFINETPGFKDRLCEFHKVDVDLYLSYNGTQDKGKILRNMVDYEAGKTIFNIARGIIEKPKSNQAALFG